MRYLSQRIFESHAADINGDGNVTITDLMRLLNYVSGKSATL
ncbi:hypothetical protein G4478_10355 [Coprococcus comes]|uniref:Dockerin domain-containing protein n=1 Tax=Coprococcus comes TaxID=410072 RepID=A0A414UE13_9FIRM|nr:hypothetical protein [Coprococcus comes]MBT9765046.1 hypothetical protein [Coprococcus comes]MBT9780771.1 hypothetical protein [Coprococcus comes]NSC13650.1 hypothetical protein [Coprococcus comes]NSC17262.1 hypothetical protein [Coprococcus comes]